MLTASAATAVDTMERKERVAVYNWAFAQGVTPMHYDWRNDTWYMSNGEPYTTTFILREARI